MAIFLVGSSFCRGLGPQNQIWHSKIGAPNAPPAIIGGIVLICFDCLHWHCIGRQCFKKFCSGGHEPSAKNMKWLHLQGESFKSLKTGYITGKGYSNNPHRTSADSKDLYRSLSFYPPKFRVVQLSHSLSRAPSSLGLFMLNAVGVTPGESPRFMPQPVQPQSKGRVTKSLNKINHQMPSAP